MISDKLRTLAALLLPLCLSAAAQSVQPANRIAAPIDESSRFTLVGNVHPMAQDRFDQGGAPASTETGRISLVLQRSAARQQLLTQYLSDLQNPGSPHYHEWITPAQYGARFGISDFDLVAVSSWLKSQGFRVDKVGQARNIVQFSGTIGQIQAAFHTSVHRFLVSGKSHFANVTDPQIPAALAPVVAGVGPLNGFHAKPDVRLSAAGRWVTSTHSIQPNLTLFGPKNAPYLFVDPADAATIYDTPNRSLNPAYTTGATYTGSGVTIGIVGVADPVIQDIANYRTGFLNESIANLPAVIIDGNDPGAVPGSAGLEALLDTEVAGGIAPGAKINFYASAGSDLADGTLNAFARAIDDNAVDVLNLSFSACEASLGSSGNQLVLELAEQAAAQGISVTVSTGDGGSDGCDNFDTATKAGQGFGLNGLASTPYTIAVGGTDFDALAASFSTYANSSTNGSAPYYLTAKGYIPERPWNNSTSSNTTTSQNAPYTSSAGATNIIAGGGGVSSIYSKPPFQASQLPADTHREVPDVSLFAGNGFYSAAWVVCSDAMTNGTGVGLTDCANTGGQFASGATFSGVGGTSAAAPAFAGILALAVQKTGGRLGQADSVLYQLANAHPSYFHDVTTGNNSVPCTAGSPNCGSNGFLTGYNAGPGYDLASGLGSTDVAALINNWTAVGLGSSSTALQINSSTAAYTGLHGTTLTFDVGVTGAGGSPTGVVAITDNADLTAGGPGIGPQSNGQFAIPLAAGTGSATYNGLPGGNYQISARYGGDGSFAASTSSPISVSISSEPSTTTLTINAYDRSTGKTVPNSNIAYGDYLFADAVISGTAEGSKSQGVATGKIQFLNGSTPLGSGAVSSGNQASWPPLNSAFAALPAGSYNLTAQYSGDASYSASSASATFNIAKAPTTTSAGYGALLVEYGNQEQIAADVLTNSFGIAPTGTFQFQIDGQPVLEPQSVYESGGYSNTNGKNNWAWADAQTIYTFSSTGQHTLSASYSGDTNYASSASSAVSVNVMPARPFFTSLGWNVPSGTLSVGQQGTAAATLYGSQHGIAPTGDITFYDNGNALPGTVTYRGQAASDLVGSQLSASIPYTFTIGGSHSLTASYSGDTNYLNAESGFSHTVTVLGPGPYTTSAGAVTIPASGQSGSTTVTITPNGGFTGTVTLFCTPPSSVAKATCGFGSGSNIAPTAQLAIAGPASTATFNVTITAQHQSAALSGWRSSGLALAAVFLVIAPMRRWNRKLRLMTLAMGILLIQTGCGGGGADTANSGTPPGTYMFTVTAASGSGANTYSTSTQISVTVQ